MFRIPAVQIVLVSKSCTILFRAPTERDTCFLRSFYSFVLVFFASFGAHVGWKVTSWLLKLQEDKCVCAFAFPSVILNTVQSYTPGSELFYTSWVSARICPCLQGGPPFLPFAS